MRRPTYYGSRYSNYFSALATLMEGYEILEETGAIFGDDSSRIDGLLVPVGPAAHCMSADTSRKFFDRPRVIGVEVKTNRADFLRGLKEGQFLRYAERLHGLYVMTYRDVCKTTELPEGVGHIVMHHHGGSLRAVCRRHPVYRDVALSVAVMWRLVFALTAAREARAKYERVTLRDQVEKLGKLAGAQVFSVLRKMAEAVEQDLDQPGWTRRGGSSK